VPTLLAEYGVRVTDPAHHRGLDRLPDVVARIAPLRAKAVTGFAAER
jgi:hypothetical protein